jgi:hypothetical protein
MRLLGAKATTRIIILKTGWIDAIQTVYIIIDLMEENHFGKYVGETNES